MHGHLGDGLRRRRAHHRHRDRQEGPRRPLARGEDRARGEGEGAKPIVSQEIWGVSRTGGLVRNGATSDGGFIASTSTGWAGERFAWTGTSAQHGKEAREKFSVEKKSDKELVLEMSLGVGELRVLFEGTCKR